MFKQGQCPAFFVLVIFYLFVYCLLELDIFLLCFFQFAHIHRHACTETTCYMMQQSRAIPLYNVSLRKMRNETISTDQKKESKVRKRGLIDGVKGICEAVTMRHSIYRGQRPTQRQRVSARWLLEIPLLLCRDTKVSRAMSLRLLMHWFSEKSCLIYPASWQRCQQLHQWLLATSTSSHHEISHNSLCILLFYTVHHLQLCLHLQYVPLGCGKMLEYMI